MKMKEIKELDHQYITGTYNRFPVTITWGSNDIAYDENGKEYIDLESGYGTNSFGFCDPDWINAVEEQLHKVQHTSNLYYTEPCAKLAELLARCTGMANMFFTNSGGEANECALKAARRYQHLHKGSDCYEIVSMKNSFHGRPSPPPEIRTTTKASSLWFRASSMRSSTIRKTWNPWWMQTAPRPSSWNAFREKAASM